MWHSEISLARYGDVVVDIEGVFVADDIVITGEYQGGGGDGFKGREFNIGLVEHHLGDLCIALAGWRRGGEHRFDESEGFGVEAIGIEVRGHRSDFFDFLGMAYGE